VEHVRVLRPADGVFAFYEGREEGHRFAAERNWVDEGALSLGIASYAIVDGNEAMIYDTHVSVDRAMFIRETLEREGVEHFTVVLSHWHLDHVAGTEAFGDCEVIACERTAEHLLANRDAIEAGTSSGPPKIDPLVLPTRTFAERTTLRIGGTSVELIHLDIHSDDAVVAWLPERRLLLAGDTLEDTVTYVDEPGALPDHLEDLTRLGALDPASILPDHGDPGVIAAGGYGPGLIAATEGYIRKLLRCRAEPGLRDLGLREFAAEWLDDGSLNWFEPYAELHRSNVAAVIAGDA
jgi:glyoxylase-like metal-dependent hydrolase (beta-lactamase superfamily II)